jgi:hypothetical protein
MLRETPPTWSALYPGQIFNFYKDVFGEFPKLLGGVDNVHV